MLMSRWAINVILIFKTYFKRRYKNQIFQKFEVVLKIVEKNFVQKFVFYLAYLTMTVKNGKFQFFHPKKRRCFLIKNCFLF